MKNIAKKIKKVVIKEGYENEEDLRDVAHEMFLLIGKTSNLLDKAASILKDKIKKLEEEDIFVDYSEK